MLNKINKNLKHRNFNREIYNNRKLSEKSLKTENKLHMRKHTHKKYSTRFIYVLKIYCQFSTMKESCNVLNNIQ